MSSMLPSQLFCPKRASLPLVVSNNDGALGLAVTSSEEAIEVLLALDIKVQAHQRVGNMIE